MLTVCEYAYVYPGVCPAFCEWQSGSEDPAASGINGCFRGVHKNMAKIFPDLVYVQEH